MTLAIVAERAPLNTDSEGVVRVAGTRVTLDTVVAAFLDGATPETIVEQYPSLPLGDVYLVLGYYLRHRDEVDSYLRQRQERREVVRVDNEARFSPIGVRERLLARRQ